MITISSAILCLALGQQPSPAILDQRFLPEIGLVTISADGSRVAVRTEKDGAKKEFEFDLPGGRIAEARCGPWLGEEMIIVLATQQGESTSYRYALSAFGQPKGRDYDPSLSAHFADPDRIWFLANPIFTSTGDPFRIVAVNDHGHGGDSLEITFRRGWIKRIEDAAKLEEKILFDSCGGYISEPLQFGRAVLLERGGSAR